MTTPDDLMDKVRVAWADVLDVDTDDAVPLDTNFLEAGGNSLLLVLLWEQLSPLAERQLRMSDLFQHSTVRAQATLLSGVDTATDARAMGANDRGRLLGRARR